MPSHSPDLEGVRHAYDTVAEDYATHLPDTRAESPLELAMVDAFLETIRPGQRVLDAGCGTGRMSRHLAARGCSVTGLDLSPGMVRMAHRTRPDLKVAVGSLTALPVRSERFAGVLVWYSTIHTPPTQQPALFREVARVVSKGGHVLIGFQAGHGTRDVAPSYRRFGHEIRLERHVFTVEQVVDWLAEAGLHEVCRLVRRPRGPERDDQAVVLARKS